jgi:hypothetical protein
MKGRKERIQTLTALTQADPVRVRVRKQSLFRTKGTNGTKVTDLEPWNLYPILVLSLELRTNVSVRIPEQRLQGDIEIEVLRLLKQCQSRLESLSVLPCENITCRGTF